jgi:hypothetical protein
MRCEAKQVNIHANKYSDFTDNPVAFAGWVILLRLEAVGHCCKSQRLPLLPNVRTAAALGYRTLLAVT